MNRKALLGLSSSLLLCGLAASCRDFPTTTNGGGSAGEPDAVGAAANDGGTSSAGNPGSDAGAASNMGGGPDPVEAPVMTGGDGGLAGRDGGGGAPVTALDDLYGAVRLFAGSDPVCGGTLLNNSWVLAPDSCVPADSAELSVAYGRDSTNPDQTQRVIEIVRFLGNTGNGPPLGRNLALLGLEHPIRVLGSVDDLHQALERVGDWNLLNIQRCAGWDFGTQPDDSSKLRAVDLTPSVVDLGKASGGHSVGDWVWWTGSPLPDSDVLAVPVASDLGAGCFYYMNRTRFLMTMISEIPPLTRGQQANQGIEAVSLGLAEAPISAWIDRTMIEEPDYLPVPAVGPAGITWSPLGSLELLAVTQDSGELNWSSQEHGDWENVSLGAPASALSKTQRPAGIFRRSGDVAVFAVAQDGGLWWKKRSGDTWGDWAQIAVDKPIASGLAVHEVVPGRMHLVAVDSDGGICHAEYRDDWSGCAVIGGNVPTDGAPAIDVPQEGRLNVFWRNAQQNLIQAALINNTWQLPPYNVSAGAPIASAPVLGHATAASFDILARLPNQHLGRHGYEERWSPEWNDLGLELPAGELSTSQRSRGHGDLIVTQPDGQVWHVAWPRAPRVQQ